MKKIDWERIGNWLAGDGQIYLLWISVIVAIIGVVFFGWHPGGADD